MPRRTDLGALLLASRPAPPLAELLSELARQGLIRPGSGQTFEDGAAPRRWRRRRQSLPPKPADRLAERYHKMCAAILCGCV